MAAAQDRIPADHNICSVLGPTPGMWQKLHVNMMS
jgi:hypothetical protein